MTRSFNVKPKEQRLIVRSDKSVVCVTNNKRLCSTFCTIEAITTDRHEGSHSLFATAELVVSEGIDSLICYMCPPSDHKQCLVGSRPPTC